MASVTVGIQQLMKQIAEGADAFHRAVYTDRDVDAALAHARDDATLVNLPVDTGASGHGLQCYLTDVVARLPAELSFRRVSRTVDQRRVVDETQVSFVHDRPVPWLLPGIAPTGRTADVLAISVITFAHASRLGVVHSQIVTHRTLWDHVGLLTQLAVDPGGQRSTQEYQSRLETPR